ncbi:MAG TPA: arsenate reductase ArsC [Microvirga sp.]|nr:arsenate reductase ArsC [Microvirga sp.]
MSDRTYNVLFLCTGNTARSILAEGILRRDGAGRFNAYSAGSQPKGTVNPLALKVLAAHRYPTDGYRSKSWDEYAEPGAPVMDFVITVCDSAAGEACPIWPGHPSIAHWGLDDPAAVEGSEADKERAFEQAFHFLRDRIRTFINLPLASLDQFTIGNRLRQIGHMEGASIGTTGDTGPRRA